MKKLTIELVPSTCWYSNVRSNVSKDIWNKIRKKSYKNAGYICEICGDTAKNQGYNHLVECHEIWEYDDKNKIQKLIGLISLCSFCHKTKHVGLAQLNNEEDIVIDQLCKVNNLTKKQTKEYIKESFEIFNQRSKFDWQLDISYVDQYLNEDDNDLRNLFK